MDLLNKKILNPTVISKQEIDKALGDAFDKLEELIPKFTNYFAPSSTTDFKYEQRINDNWVNGMQTGQYWLAYELTGDKKFRDVAEKHVQSFKNRIENMIGLNNHDIGFLYTPSCVADYIINGNENSKKIALAAAKLLLERFSEKGGFIIRSGDGTDYNGYRSIIDTMMNLPLLFWAWRETGDDSYRYAAETHYRTTMKYLVRKDFSTFHHYQFDPETGNPVGGLTFQGNADDSCWSRGHAWGIYGFPIAYSYNNDKEIPEFHKNYTYYFLNQLPSDNIPYWDFDFKEGDTAPRDSSAAAIAVCGLNEMNKLISDKMEQKVIFKNAQDAMMKSLIDKCGKRADSDGILHHVTHALPQGIGIDESAVYGDYFYLEALMRYAKPDWKRYW